MTLILTLKRSQGKKQFVMQLIIGPGGELPCERGGDGRRKFWIKPLKETNLDVAQSDHFTLWLHESTK